MQAVKTVLHAYNFNIANAEEKAQYLALVESLKAQGLRCFETHGGASHYVPELAGPVELETKHLFDNQWNTGPMVGKAGYRVFDWAMDSRYAHGNPNLKRGHWIEQTEEMRAVRANRCKCGYCGNQMTMPDVPAFCPQCLDSEHLKSDQLHLTRMQPIANNERAPLTEAELAERLPLYKAAQIHGSTERSKVRIAKRRARLVTGRDDTIKHANIEHDGNMWLMDRGITEEPIYYKHTGRFCFGWRNDGGVDAAVKPELIAALEGFPFPYDVK